jgi:hypothetical protein
LIAKQVFAVDVRWEISPNKILLGNNRRPDGLAVLFLP